MFSSLWSSMCGVSYVLPTGPSMARARQLVYLGVVLLMVVFVVAFTSESFSLNTFLRPVPHSPRIGKLYTEGKSYTPVSSLLCGLYLWKAHSVWMPFGLTVGIYSI